MKLIENLLFVGQLCPLSATRRLSSSSETLRSRSSQSQQPISSLREPEAINPPFLVHKSLVHKSLGHRKFGIFLWFTFFLSSQISGEPVNHGSKITPAPNIFILRN